MIFLKKAGATLMSVLLLCPAVDSFAQAWSGIIDSSRAIDWQANQPGVIGGIRSNRTQCGSTIAPTPSAAIINNAVAACPPNTYVLLGPGTFNLTSPIILGKSNVTLRGSGPDNTTVNFSETSSGAFLYCGIMGGLLCIEGQTSLWAGGADGAWSTAWTAGYAPGTTQITVGSTANTAAGRFVFLDQLDDQVDNGGIVNSSIINTFSGEGLPAEGRCLPGECPISRTQTHMHKVVSVDSATQLTITPPIQMPNFRSGLKPGMYGLGFSDADVVVGVGLEDMTIHNVNILSDGQNAIVEIANAYGSWAKNIRTINGLRDHFTTHQGAHIEIRDCYLYGAVGSSSQSYGIESQGASDNLYINNIAEHTTAPIIGPCPGCVIAYNYTYGNYYTDSGNCAPLSNGGSACNWIGIAGSHDSGGGMMLVEGNQTAAYMSDCNHGNSALYTLFRNAFTGDDDEPGKLFYLFGLELSDYARAYNVIGNVLGTAGIQDTYQDATSSPQAKPIFNLGFSPYGNMQPTDSVVTGSLLRWGNYDTVHGSTQWNSTEIPTAAIPFINGNPVPATQTLPESFFLTAKPSFWTTPWGTPAWPPIGPDVSGGQIAGVAGHVHKIPARLCFENMASDTAYSAMPPIKSFNANNCYNSAVASSAPPSKPSGLTLH